MLLMNCSLLEGDLNDTLDSWCYIGASSLCNRYWTDSINFSREIRSHLILQKAVESMQHLSALYMDYLYTIYCWERPFCISHALKNRGGVNIYMGGGEVPKSGEVLVEKIGGGVGRDGDYAILNYSYKYTWLFLDINTRGKGIKYSQ